MNYNSVIEKIKNVGELIAADAGRVPDIGIEKQWLTERDLFVERELVRHVSSLDSKANFYAEELHNEAVQSDSVWVMDPISNTFNFIHGLPGYAISVSHLVRGEAVFAAIYDPASREMFTAEKGTGSFLNGVRISVKASSDGAILLGGAGKEGTLERTKEIYKSGVVRNFGSVALHYAYVACGRAAAAITFNKDTFPEFAGKLLVEEAGGRFTDFFGNRLSIVPAGIIATNGDLHDFYIQVLSPKDVSIKKT
ncbi:MAG TPA: inositol monophosphatase [Candidatus Paceibacterota bacterium]